MHLHVKYYYQGSQQFLKTKDAHLFEPVGSAHPHFNQMTHQICFHRLESMYKVSLGQIQSCAHVFNATCAPAPTNSSRCLVPVHPSKANSTLMFPKIPHASCLIQWPDDIGMGTPQDLVWLCGSQYYQALIALWSGTYALISLSPDVIVLDQFVYNTHHYPQFMPSPRDPPLQ